MRRRASGTGRPRQSRDEICELLGIRCDHCGLRVGVDHVGYFVHSFNWAMTCNVEGTSDATVNGHRRWP